MDCVEKNNLLIALHKWCGRQDENFFTDAFAFLLRHLCAESPEVAVRVLSHLTNGCLQVAADNVKTVEISTQETTEHDGKRPDMKIRASDQLVYVEVKIGSQPEREQLENYRAGLDREQKKDGLSQCLLVLLTKERVDLSSDEGKSVNYKCCLQDVTKWLSDEVKSRGGNLPEVSGFLLEQFIGFLKAMGCAMERVTSALVPGVKSFLNLVKMIEEAISARGIKKHLHVDQLSYGWNLTGTKFWMGVWYFNWPGCVEFEVRGQDKNVAEVNESWYSYRNTDKQPWVWFLELDLEKEPGYFDLSAQEQQKRISKFLDDCLRAAKEIEPK